MAETDFNLVVEKERDRLTGLRSQAVSRRADVDAEIAEIDKQLAALNAYQRARKGRGPSRNRSGRQGSRQGAILELLAAHPEGMTRGEILLAFDVKGDPVGEQAISNALANMKKGSKLASASGGRYVLP